MTFLILQSSLLTLKKKNEIKTFYIANIHYGTYSIRLPYYTSTNLTLPTFFV